MKQGRFSKIKTFLLVLCLTISVCAFSVGFLTGCGEKKQSGSTPYRGTVINREGEGGGDSGDTPGGGSGGQDTPSDEHVVDWREYIPEIGTGEDGGEEKQPETLPPRIRLFNAQDGQTELGTDEILHLGTIDRAHFNGVLDLPVARAEDDADGDITGNMYVVSATGSKFSTVRYDATRFGGRGGYTFQSNVGGRHEIIYFVMDSEGNEAYRSITVDVVAKTDEKELGGSNELSVLEESGETFTENFEQGPNSPLLKNNYRSHFKLTGDENAIEGNSLLVDYTEIIVGNGIYFLNVSPYLKTGIWDVEFDVKLVEGEGFETFYFAYGKGDDSFGARYTLKGLSKGQTRHVNYKQGIEIPEDEEGYWYFYIYNNDTSSPAGCILALDNFKFTRVENPAPTYEPTIEELKQGVTFDWSDDYYTTLGVPTDVSSIEDGTVRAALEANEHFGDRVMHLNNSSVFTGLTSYKNGNYFEPNKVYDVTIYYYVKTLGEAGINETMEKGYDARSSYLILYDDTENNRLLTGALFTDIGQATSTSVRFVTGSGETKMTLYTKADAMQWDVYIGDIVITRTDKCDLVVDAEDYHTLTSEDVAKEGGYTFDMTRGNIPYLLNDDGYMSIEYYSTANLPENLAISDAAHAYFAEDGGNGNAVLLTGSSLAIIGAEDNLIKAGKTYKVEMTVYSKDPIDPRKHILHFTDSAHKEQPEGSDIVCAVISLGDGMYKIAAIYEGRDNYDYFGFYTESYMNLLLSSMTISEITTRQTVTVSKSDINNKTYTSDFSSGALATFTRSAYAEYLGEGVATVLHVVSGTGGCLVFDSFNGLIESGKVYTMTLTGESLSAGNLVAIMMDANRNQVGSSDYSFSSENIGGNKVRLTLSFLADQAYYSICVYNISGVFEMNVDSVSLSSLNDTRSEQTASQIKTLAESESGYVSDFNTYKFNMGSLANAGVNSAIVSANLSSTPYTYSLSMYSTGEATDKTELKLNSLNSVFADGKMYTLTLNGTGTATGVLYLLAYSDTGYTNLLTVQPVGTAINVSGDNITITAIFVAPAGTKAIMIWTNDTATAVNMTVTSISLKGENQGSVDTRSEQTASQIKTLAESESGYVSDFNNYKFMMGSIANATDVNAATVTANIESVPYTYSLSMYNTGEATDKTELKLNSLSGVFVNGGHYVLTLNGTGTATGTIYLFCYSDTGYNVQLAQNFNTVLSVNSGAISIVFDFDAPDGTKALMIWAAAGTTVDMTVTSISLKGTVDIESKILSDDGYEVKADDDNYEIYAGRTNATHTIVTGTGISGLGDASTKYGKVELDASSKNQLAYKTFGSDCFADGYNYVFRVKLYSEVSDIHVLLLTFDSAHGQLGAYSFNITDKGNGYYYYEATFTGSTAIDYVMLYCNVNGTYTAFIESITLKGFAITDDLIASENGVTVNVSDFMPYSRSSSATLTQGIPEVTAEGTYLYVNMSQTDPALSLDVFNGHFTAGEAYTLSFTAYEVNGGSILFLPMDAGGAQINSISYNLNKPTLGGGFYEFTATFTAPEGMNSMLVYFVGGNGQEMYISSVTLKKA